MSSGHFSDYQRLGDAAIKVLGDFTPLVERISIDEAFADVAGCTHLFGSPAEIAGAIRARVRSELGLPISVGVARTKHLAKIASQVAKPDGLVVVDPDNELDFLHGLAVELMWGVGPVTKARLAEIGVRDDRAAGEHTADGRSSGLLGPAAGEKLAALAWNRDPRRIRTHHRARSAGAQSALGRKPAVERVFRPTLLHLADRIAHAAPRQVAARPHRDGPRSLRRSELGHALGHARRADLRDRDARRDRRGTGARGPRGSPGREDHLAAGDLRVASRGALGSRSWNSRLASTTKRAAPAARIGLARFEADRAVDKIRDRFGWEAIGYGSMALGMSRSVPDEFRKLAEKDL